MSVLLAGWGPAWADNVTVNCPDSINAALATLDKDVPNGVTISGTCTEAVVVDGFKDLSLGGSAVIQRPQPPIAVGDESALTIRESRVWISNLTFEGPGLNQWSAPLVSVSRSNVDFGGCTIQDSLGTGLYVENHSGVQIVGTTVADNGTGMSFQEDSDVWIEGTTVSGNGTGIAAGTSAHVQLSNWWGDVCTIENNDYGIAASRDALVEVGLATIQNNRQQGVGASNDAVVNLGAWGWGELTITGNGSDNPNGAAVQAGDGGIIGIIQPTTIEDNYGTGASAGQNGTLYVCCGATPEDTRISGNGRFGFELWMGGGLFFWGPALVEGNLRGGISVDSAEAFLVAGVLIQGNGDSSDPDSYGGLRIVDNARVNTSATVIDNNGPGVFVSAGATVLFQPHSMISGNQGYGVELEAASSAVFDNDTTATGNRAFDLVCSSGSVAGAPQGMHPVIGKKKCQAWTQLRGYPAWLEDLLEP